MGRSFVDYALEKGDKVVATLRDPTGLSDLAEKFDSSRLLMLQVDVTKIDTIKAAFAKVKETFGRIDIVCNNAGFGILSEVEGTPDEVARKVFETNFWGAVSISKESIAFFRDVNKPCGGRLLQMSSMAGVGTVPGVAFYSSRYCVSDYD